QFVGAFIHDLFQLDCVVSDRLFEEFAVVNIGTGSVPLHDLPLWIQNRDRPGSKPAVDAIFGAHPILRFVTLTLPQGLHPTCLTALHVFRMHIVQPTYLLSWIFRSSRISVKPVTHIVVMSISLAAEDDVWRSAHNRIEFLVLAAQRGIQLR